MYKFNDFTFRWQKIKNGTYEINVFKYLYKSIGEGDTILDVGAWIGQYTLLISNLVGKKGKIYSFEPDSRAFMILHENISKNNLKNVYIEKCGLSNVIGKKKLYLYEGAGKSVSFLIFDKKEKGLKYELIDITTLDRFCEENNIHPNGIKIDVEGAEGSVIEGAKNTIERCSPWILLEFHGHKMSEEERIKIWQNVVNTAKKVLFIEGSSNKYKFGMEVKSIPDYSNFIVFIQY